MNGYTDLTTNIENSRNCLRRIARHDDQEFSNQSIINVMEKFVKTVNAMDETILVPSRLMDRQVGDSTDTVPVSPKAFHHGHTKSKKRDTVREYLNSADLLKLYNMLNLVKNDLLWARNDTSEEVKQEKSAGELSTNVAKEEVVSKEEATVKGHVRRPSTISMSSSHSVSTLSDSESEISNENDSGIESESRRDLDKSQELAKQFRTHLLGLYRSLEQMTEAANYLTARYQSDVGPV
ncbi:mid1-interacting protein 1-like [Phlebotomus argentipes]|uniref:mid1-interacting protein 1-like n=1 Tax=Phlebotomus argentipes TaxID=94469 RepID=UPI0028935DD3|nr:mid1-interacting protein 1-like [Phlebotomus argentipes]